MGKKLLIFLCILSITSVCFAQHTNIYVIDDFSKLLQDQVSPYILPKGAASEARNVRSNDIYGSLAKRSTLMDYGTLGNFTLTSLHRFYKSNDTQFLLGTGSTYIVKGDDSGGTALVLRDQLTSGLRYTWATYKDKAIGCGGTDRCQKYDGHTQITANTDGSRTENIITADLGAPFAEQNTGANLDASSWYQYKIQGTNGSTTWYSEAVSNPILTGSTVRDITLTDIPLFPSGTTSRSIYRTEGQANRAALSGATFKLVASVANNTATTYNDAVADGSLTTAWSTSGKSALTPPIAKFVTLHKDRLFLANAPNLNSYIYWSYPFRSDIFSASDYDYVRIDDGDEITGQIEMLGKLVYFKTNSITNFETQSTDDTKWPFYTYSFTGCPAPYSIANSPLGVFYLGWDGIYIYTGEESQLVSDVVTASIRDILASNRNEVVGTYFQGEYQLAYTSDKSGSSDNNVVMVLDTVRDSYVLDDRSVGSFTTFDSGNDYGTLYMGSSVTGGEVFSYNPSLSNAIIRYKSELEAGTKDSLTIGGTESVPFMELGWGIKINDASMSGVSLNSLEYSSATINRPGLTGYWWSSAIQLDGNTYDKLLWNEILGATGDITIAIRSAATASAATADSLSWSSEFTDPSGSDISGETANDFLQMRAILTTTDITQTPSLEQINNYVIKMIYSKVGSAGETAINSIWRGRYEDLGAPTVAKRIWGLNIYFSGTSGTMTIGYRNELGDIDGTFDIDLSVDPDDDSEDLYFGTGNRKVYKWLAAVNDETDPTPIGRNWQFSITEPGATDWNVYRIVVKYSEEDYYED